MAQIASNGELAGRATTVACAASLHALGEATLSQLAQATGLSRPTVKERLADLPHLVEVTSGMEHGVSPTPTGGRPPSRFRFRREYGYVIGAEIGKHHERIVACDLGGGIRHFSERHEPDSLPGRERIASFRHRLGKVVAQLEGKHGRWLGLGITLTGGVADDGRLSYSPFSPDLQGSAPADLGLSFGRVPVIVEHDLNAAAIAEHCYGAAREADTFILALAWYQLAAGIVLDGRVHRGARNMAGQLNLIADVPDAPRHWTELESFRLVVDAATRGERAAIRDVDRFAAQAARQIAYLTLAIDPQLIVLGGPLAQRRALTDRISTHLGTLLPDTYPVRLAVTQYPTLGPSLGALQLALTRAMNDLLGDQGFTPTIDLTPLRHHIDQSQETQHLTAI
jgi:predicted NBD/HSP70 family sugar kinase